MVNPLDFIPKLSGFSPMPLGIMAPFMGYQSAALAYNFGLNYEFGKRVIKSMSNEKFNKIAEDPILLNELTSKHHDVLLQAFINEVPKVQPIQKLIIDELVKLEFEKIKIMPQLISQIPKGFIEGLFNLSNGNTSNPEVTTSHNDFKPPPKDEPKSQPTVEPPSGSKTKIISDKKVLFKPKLIPIKSIPSANSLEAIARVVKLGIANKKFSGSPKYVLQVQQTVGKWTQIFALHGYSKREIAMTLMSKIYKSPLYFPDFRGDSVYYFRIK